MLSVFLYTVLKLASATSCLFFFQAEDGIRDIGVTGVQTCALPISGPGVTGERRGHARARRRGGVFQPRRRRGVRGRDRPDPRGVPAVAGLRGRRPRSEERRVGKECRSRWPPYP